MDDLFMTDEGGDIFEPRNVMMTLRRDDEQTVRLTHPASPLTGIVSETIFRVGEPDQIDVTFRATLTRPPRQGRWFGFFWASYLNGPESPAIHFLDATERWATLSADRHGRNNTVCHQSVKDPQLGDPKRIYRPDSLAHAYSERRFSKPLMYGRPGDGHMMWVLMFDQAEPLRITMSPSGGGTNDAVKTYNPAWDFQYIVHDPPVGKTIELRARLVYRPYTGRRKIEELYAAWL